MRGALALVVVAAAFRPAPPRRRTSHRHAANLEEAVRRKLDEARALDRQHAGLDSDARLRLGYVADRGNVRFSAAVRRGDGMQKRVAVVADVKRRSPHGGPDGGPLDLAAFKSAGTVVTDVAKWPVDAVCVSVEKEWYGGVEGDVVEAARALRNTTTPLLVKDLVVAPIQVALAAESGADAVWLSATILGGALPDLLDACTVAGVEGAVECHTPNEVQFALEAGATLLICSDRDRATGELHRHQCLGLKGFIPPNIVALAAGGLGTSLADVRALAAAGFDGVVLGRALVADPGAAREFVAACRALELDAVDQLAWG